MPVQKTSREEILAKAFEVFRRKGYHGTSIADLARACDIQKALFYYYFDNKEHLMRALLESVVNYFRERILAPAYDEELSTDEKFEALSKGLARVFGGGQGGCIMANTALASVPSLPEFRPVLQEFFDITQEALERIYREKLSEHEARDQAETTIANIEGSLILMQVYDDPEYLKRALQRAAQPLQD